MDTQASDGLHTAEISNAMVGIYKEQFGRGPTKTRTHYAGKDIIISTLEDSLTPAERRLAEMGEAQRLRDTRMFFQHATREHFVGRLEEITGRTVRAFVSGIDVDVDVSSEVFYLVPVDS
jgi:uncharacterized protein YbcI